MTKKIFILSLVLGLTACATQAPLDDAYYWPDKQDSMVYEKTKYSKPSKDGSIKQTTVLMQTTTVYLQTSETSQHVDTIKTQVLEESMDIMTSPKLEYTNIQDTTVTVRIKK